jgi:hypothetical protein
MRRRLSNEHSDAAVIPRYLLTAEERLQLSPVLSKHIQEARTSPYRHQVQINHNYQTVTSRYQQQATGAVDRGGVRGPVTPSRPDAEEPHLALSATQSPRPHSSAPCTSSTPQPRRRSLSPSLARFPTVQSRYLQDPRLTSSPSRDVPSAKPTSLGGGSVARASSNSPRRSATPTQRPIQVPVPAPVLRTPSPFRAGQRAATPEEISRRNNALLLRHKKIAVVSTVATYIRQRSPSRSRTPQDRPVLSPGYVRNSSPDSRRASPSARGRSPDPSHHRLVSAFSRAHSPTPVRRKFIEEERFIDHWREERSAAKVPAGHVPRVATLSLGYELSRPVSPGPPPLIHWVPQPTPRTS